VLALLCAARLRDSAWQSHFGRIIEALLFQVSATDPAAIMLSLMALGVAAACAALPPALRAKRIDPARHLPVTLVCCR
jgi:hypothetical protein